MILTFFLMLVIINVAATGSKNRECLQNLPSGSTVLLEAMFAGLFAEQV